MTIHITLGGALQVIGGVTVIVVLLYFLIGLIFLMRWGK